ncbi:hypothetical protein O181_077799 [Austropuccinia psidii MF-1]|uniref:Retrotransposon Copia-like N-terminal domain-containing protein n=1 Tax=Austropuccinia psidii MF-1 TaxID=1389203 RepID=A0A9Q3FFM9_9BASI|nr:hypothetical protein [Austropuccinia psidii MF-1]
MSIPISRNNSGSDYRAATPSSNSMETNSPSNIMHQTRSEKPLYSSILHELTQQGLSASLKHMSLIEPLNSANYSNWSNKIKFALKMRNLESFLDPEWTSGLSKEPENAYGIEFVKNFCKQVYSWIGDHLDQENFDKFYDQDLVFHNPALLWEKIKDHYAASSAKNCATIFCKIFSFHMEESNIRESIAVLRHQVNLLKMMCRKIVDVDTLTNVLALYVLQSLPASFQIISNNIY